MNLLDKQLTEQEVNEILRVGGHEDKMVNGEMFTVDDEPFYGPHHFDQFTFHSLRGILYYIRTQSERQHDHLEKKIEKLRKKSE